MKIDKFVLAVVLTIVVAYFFPQFGEEESVIPLDRIASIGISMIFFFYGLKLSLRQLVSGLKNWRLHLLIQLSTFLIFPLLVIMVYPFFQGDTSESVWLAFLFLAALPSTVSSSVVMVSLAKGNMPAAIFNASISGLIGILITPLWVGIFLQQSSVEYSLGDIYLKLLIEILLPLVLGLFLQKYWGRFALKYSAYLTWFDKSIILLIIYKSFAESFEEDIFTRLKAIDLALIGLGVGLLFFIVYFTIGYISRMLNFNREDQITAQFCGTKKSLVHGTVFSKVLFPESMALGIMLLPLMIFHAFQILVISFIATRAGGKLRN
ncbi:bile acid:sodium symporter family protein [Psychroflexus sediminis]|uniref:Solute carrier family 10 (Sodium/bile acid cotransporter), member 7 n=1 Tax=Psychroflexus sediminis TaxID=470826 RepID=A0A1G7XZ01_9FLAO|nr:bile acid:sodium symporter family protein [Psychroflexus sediminis]SDG89398.1 solute carrier family 10 (sodium/bile acid cotransporter), member 7 [Psychroflexus sediminis]